MKTENMKDAREKKAIWLTWGLVHKDPVWFSIPRVCGFPLLFFKIPFLFLNASLLPCRISQQKEGMYEPSSSTEGREGGRGGGGWVTQTYNGGGAALDSGGSVWLKDTVSWTDGRNNLLPNMQQYLPSYKALIQIWLLPSPRWKMTETICFRGNMLRLSK